MHPGSQDTQMPRLQLSDSCPLSLHQLPHRIAGALHWLEPHCSQMPPVASHLSATVCVQSVKQVREASP